MKEPVSALGPTGDIHVPSNPFSNPFPPQLQRPEPCKYAPGSPRRSRDADNVGNRRHDSLSPASYKASFSSVGSSPAMTPNTSVENEKAAMSEEEDGHYYPAVHSHDPEKQAMSDARRASRNSRRPQASPATSEIISLTYDDDDDGYDADGRRLQERKALRILLYLSMPCVFLSVLNAVWAVVSVFITVLTQPVRICARRPSFGLQLAGLLGPSLNVQLRAIYTPLSPHANEDASYNVGWLFLVHLLAPFVSFCNMFMAWVVAVYWASSAVVGDPAGTDKRDDGRDTVLGLRKWWENFLLKAVLKDTCLAL